MSGRRKPSVWTSTPDAMRHNRPRRLSLTPAANAVVDGLPDGARSAWVSAAILAAAEGIDGAQKKDGDGS